MAQLAERVIEAVGWWWLVFRILVRRSIVIVVVDDWRGQEGCSAGVCEGICCLMNKFIVKDIPFLEKGGVVSTLNLVEVAVIIIGL